MNLSMKLKLENLIRRLIKEESAISYKYKENTNKDILGIQVFSNKKYVGDIRKVSTGWQYFPKGRKIGGIIMNTFQMVQKSLEEE